jgi:hypothetical protein
MDTTEYRTLESVTFDREALEEQVARIERLVAHLGERLVELSERLSGLVRELGDAA